MKKTICILLVLAVSVVGMVLTVGSQVNHSRMEYSKEVERLQREQAQLEAVALEGERLIMDEPDSYDPELILKFNSTKVAALRNIVDIDDLSECSLKQISYKKDIEILKSVVDELYEEG